jgi:hypothetical protein
MTAGSAHRGDTSPRACTHLVTELEGAWRKTEVEGEAGQAHLPKERVFGSPLCDKWHLQNDPRDTRNAPKTEHILDNKSSLNFLGGEWDLNSGLHALQLEPPSSPFCCGYSEAGLFGSLDHSPVFYVSRHCRDDRHAPLHPALFC